MSAQPLHGIVTPHDHDVLSGRGNFVNYHVGNEHFRALVRKHKLAYVACPKPQKGKFSKMIVDEIRERNPPGRFLKQDPRTKLWYDIGEKKALDKTRQALREGAPEILKELSGDKEDVEDDSGEDGGDGTSSPVNTPQMVTAPQTVSAHVDPSNNLLSCDQNGITSSAFNLDGGGYNGNYNMNPSQNMLNGMGQQHALNASQHNNISASQHGISISQHGISVSQHGVSASQHGISPSQHGLSTSHHGTSHHGGTGLSTSQHGLHTSQHGNNMHGHGMMNGMMALQPQTISSSSSPSNHMSSSQHGMSPSPMLHPGMSFQQQAAQHASHQQSMLPPPTQPMHRVNRLNQSSRMNTASGGMNVNLLGNSPCTPFQDTGLKIPSLSSNPYSSDQLDPRPIDPNLPLKQNVEPYRDQYADFEPVAPLPPPRRVPVKLKRENSEQSLKVDNIFRGSGSDGHTDKAKMNGSSAHLSIMSLSLGDVVGSASDHTPIDLSSEEPIPLEPTPSGSRQHGEHKFLRQIASPRAPKRSGNSSIDQYSVDFTANMDMSAVTLGTDRLSDFGDNSTIRMTESQVNMSFSNVFEEMEREIMNHR